MSIDLNEAETRKLRIDGQLARAGWGNAEAHDFQAELEVGSVGEPTHGFVDYALPDHDGSVLAVVEAKRSSRDALAGKEQARQYAEALEAGQGYRPFVYLANGDEIWFWDHVSNPRRVSGFFSAEDLERRKFQLSARQPLADVEIDSTIVERPYQHEAIRRAHEALTEGRRKLLWIMATGTGKTRTATALVDTLLRGRWAQRILFLTDRDELANQALNDGFKTFLRGEPAERIFSGSYDNSRRLYVATLQTMQDFHESFSPGAFDLVISDECHRSIYNKWEAVLAHFDAYLVGLTATPADFIDRSTFDFFACPDKVPTFGYEFQQAVDEGYLVNFEAYHARTSFQIDGIHGSQLPAAVQAELIEQGIDPNDIDFSGTELERKVTNKETTRLLVDEFFENAIKEPESNLPGKSIIFAMSHAHAKRIWETFNEQYPQFPGMAEIIDSHMEQPGAMLKRFKEESLPRIAISVDMLDTGVDVPTITNLGFMKPVFSRIKFWQMLGRGTRKVDARAAKPWCPEGSKDVFRTLDFWSNFERFQLNPDGVEPSTSTPVAVRRFRALIRAAEASLSAGRSELREQFLQAARQMIGELPVESAGVREERLLIETVSSDQFWLNITEARRQTLNFQVAPLMRFLGGVDVAATTFDIHCLEAVTAELSGVPSDKHVRSVRDDLMRLPIDHPSLRNYRDELISRHNDNWVSRTTVEELLALRDTFSPHMHLRQSEPSNIIKLNLHDAFSEQRWIAVGPDAHEFDVATYRRLVEERVRLLVNEQPAMLRLATGGQLTDGDIAAIESALNQPDLYITEDSLRSAYRAPHGSLVALLKHALGVEALITREDAIRTAFESFVSEKGYLSAEQLTFVRLFARRLIEVGRVRKPDFYEEPFLRVGIDVDSEIPSADLDALLSLAAKYEVE